MTFKLKVHLIPTYSAIAGVYFECIFSVYATPATCISDNQTSAHSLKGLRNDCTFF